MRAVRLAFVAWMVALLLWVWGVQRPIPWTFGRALVGHGGVVLALAGLLAGAWAFGEGVVRVFPLPEMSPGMQALYRLGLGMAGWAWLGLALAWIGLSHRPVLVALWVVWAGWGFGRMRNAWPVLCQAFSGLPRWVWGLAGLTFFLALLPPTSVDGLMYHLSQPEWLLQTGGYRPYPVVHFWNPGFVESLNLWLLALHADRAARLLQGLYALNCLALLYQWTKEAFGPRSARYALLVLGTMPSFPLLASWAYTDFALTFYALLALYGLYRYMRRPDPRWMPYLGWAVGLAVSVKYTAFIVPLAVGGSLIGRREGHALVRFLAWSGLTGLPFYLRNAWFMGNPVYPFLFGGRFWDAFLTQWYSGAGSGLLSQPWTHWLAFPFRVVAGIDDLSYVDGRIGPWWLILAPWAVFWILRRVRRISALVWATGPYLVLGLAAWLWGAMWSKNLWQARLLLPVLFPLALWMGHAVQGLRLLHGPAQPAWRTWTARLLALSVFVVLLEHILAFVRMDGPAVLTGALTRDDFYRRHIPAYAELRAVLRQLPPDAHVYALYELRRYDLPRALLPDTLLAHWAYSLSRYGSPEAAARAWAAAGYTHVLLYRPGAEFLFETEPESFTPAQKQALAWLTTHLPVVARSPSGAYVVYSLQPYRQGGP